MSVYLFRCDGSYLQQVGSSIVAHRLSSCDTRTPEPTGSVAGNPRASSRISSLTSDHTCVPALQGVFFTAGPPGKFP